MRKKFECCECGKALKKDEVALCKKLLGTDTRISTVLTAWQNTWNARKKTWK